MPKNRSFQSPAHKEWFRLRKMETAKAPHARKLTGLLWLFVRARNFLSAPFCLRPCANSVPRRTLRRATAIDALGLAVVRAVPASRAACLCQSLSAGGSQMPPLDKLRVGARRTNCGTKGAILQHPGGLSNHVGFYQFRSRACGGIWAGKQELTPSVGAIAV
jgi:hypothetical protein